MRTALCVTILISCLAPPALAQHQFLGDAFDEFAASRFWQHEEITVTWNMEGTLQADLNDGINYLLEGKPDLAESSLTTVLQKDSTQWQAWYFRAAARKQRFELKGARHDLQYTIKLNPNFYEGYVELVKVHHLLGQVAESERAMKKAIQLDKSKPVAYYLKGDIDFSKGMVKAAIRNYKDCVASDSLFHEARIKLAIIDFISSKNAKEAIRLLTQVLEYDSLQKDALLFRSLFQFMTDKSQSERDLSNLIRVSPDNVMGYFLRGIHYSESERFDRAFSDFRQVIQATAASDNLYVGKQTWLDKKIDLQNVGAYALTRIYGLPDAESAALQQAFCHIITGAYEKSIGVINETANPNEEPLAVYLKAVAYEHKGEHRKAFQFYNLALKLDTDIVDAYKKRGIYLQEMKQWDQSIKDFTIVIDLDPGVFFTYRLRGVSYYYRNEFQKAITDYNIYLQHDSTNKEILSYRGMAYLKSKQRLNAYIDFARSENQQAFEFNDMNHLVDSVLVAGDTTLALQAVNAFTTAAPYCTEAYVQKFRIHLARNEWKDIDTDIYQAVRNSRADAPKADHAYLLTLQAMNYARNRHETDALKTFEQAIRFDKNNALAYLERGKMLLAMGKPSKAEEDFKRASSLGNTQADVLLVNGMKNGRE
jgi:tetratricopeptide (TPR) repeat protein